MILKISQKYAKILVVCILCVLCFVVFMRYKNKNEVIMFNNNDIEIVIARYNEELSWVEKEFPNFKVTIYNKGKDDIVGGKNMEIINIPNVGRESNTYLYHIIKNYNNLKKNIMFMQGYPYDHMNLKALQDLKKRKIRKNNDAASIVPLGDNVQVATQKTLSNYNVTYNDLKTTKWSDTSDKNKWDLSNFSKFYDINIPKDRTFVVNFGAQFLVTRDTIHQRPLSFYEKLKNGISYDKSPIEGHYMERLWDVVFLK